MGRVGVNFGHEVFAVWSGDVRSRDWNKSMQVANIRNWPKSIPNREGCLKTNHLLGTALLSG
jgi:hypothetical protein